MNMDKNIGSKLFNAINLSFLAILSLLMLYPLWREISLSFSAKEEALRGGLFLWPQKFTVDAYKSVLGSDYIWSAYGNSIFITVVGTVLSLFLTSCTAYALAKQSLPWRKIFIFFILFTMIFNGGLIPTYLVMKELGLINSLWAIIVLHLASAFNTIIMLNFIRTLPDELEESATMDGANPIRIFFQIIIPLCKPVLATLALWIAVGLWNNFFQSFIYLNDKALMTLPILLRLIIAGQQEANDSGEMVESSSESVIAATIIVSLIPILLVYPFLQKHFIKGALLGSVKS